MSREMGMPMEQQRAPEQTEFALQVGSIAAPGSAEPAPAPEHVTQGEQPLPTIGHTPQEGGTVNRRVLGMTWPVVGEHLLENLLGVVDTLLVAGLGMAALAGVGSSLQMMFFVLSALSALSVGSSILVAQAVGARDFTQASRLARQSLIWSFLLSIPLAVVGLLFARPIIGIFGMEPHVAQIGVEYLQVTMGTVVVLVALVIGGGVLRGAGDSRTPMLVTAAANVVNIGLTYALIYGHWGLPALGAVGSAWGTFLARGMALVLLLVVLWKGRNGVGIRMVGSWRPDWSIARRVLGLGIPAAVEQILMSLSFLVLTILVARLGTETLAAQRVAMTVLGFCYLPAIGFSIAATTLVGQSIGARDPQEAAEVAKVATLWSTGLMVVNMVLLLLFAAPVMGFFTSEPDVVRIGASALLVVALMLPTESIGIVLAGALRGTGDTRYPLIVGSAGMWGAVLLAWIGLTFIGGGLPMAWAPWLLTLPATSWLIWKHFLHRIRALREA
jgi:multidrug resistance protein, MATE family